ncbi:ester cyclase [Ferruginibacter lapsinanis]|uniref:ester cyclase n=1 Tax=Ferruginibacter lapsinanis TaxID=563172 RepID=UPI001E3C84DD|nr:ester cyclase [Ferruginibacter lapsinanis]UEG49217.1 ester cyclase [Ferruginibacter lapsinanis]
MKKIIVFLLVAAGIYSCKNSPAGSDMAGTEAHNKMRMQQFYDQVFNAHAPAMIDSFCVSDFVDHNPDPGHSGKGTDDLKAQFTDMMTGIPDVKVTTKFMVAEGDTVVAYVTINGTNTGPMGKMPATNKSFTMDGIDIVVIKGDKAVERWGIFDNMSMMAQMGMMGGAPPADSTKMAPKKM